MLHLAQQLLTILSSSYAPIKACHCNCYFKRKTRLALQLNHYIPRCPFYTTFYAFRRTGVHPPLLPLTK
ncbi:MAG: hypothetical protein L3J43_06300 [Sulfurovum sp.]|nr:hypothetical protein [Sulfurovum sp.]